MVNDNYKNEREGERNREKIFEVIRKYEHNGARPKEIIKETGLSKESVHNHLQVLQNKKRIHKQNHRYYPQNHILNEMINFSSHMKECIPMLISKSVIESDPQVEEYLKRYPKQGLHKPIKTNLPKKISFSLDTKLAPELHMYFFKMVLGSTISKSYCKTDFASKSSLEKCIFEFANRIGMYIMYILIQSLYPLDLEILELKDKDRAELAQILISKSISTGEIFDAFRQLITELGMTDCDLERNEHRALFQLSEGNFKILSNAARSLYPKIFDGLENWWFNSTTYALKVNTSMAMTSSCQHQWTELYIFKYGMCKLCTKCYGVTVGSIKSKAE